MNQKNSLPHIQQKLPLKLIQSRNASFVISKTQESDSSMRSKDKSPLRIIRQNTGYRSVTPFDDRGETHEKSFHATVRKQDYESLLKDEVQVKQKDDKKIQEKLKEMELERMVQQGDYYSKRFGSENKRGKPVLKKLEKYHSSSTVQTIHDFSLTKKEGHSRFMTPVETLETQEDEVSISQFQKTIPSENSPERIMSIRRRVQTEDGGDDERMKEYLKKMEYKNALDMQMLEKKMRKKREEEMLAYEGKMKHLKKEYNRLMTEVVKPPKHIPRIGKIERNTSYDSQNLMELSKILELYKPKKENSSSPVKTDLSSRRMNDTIKKKGMKHSYSTADETNSPNYINTSSSNQSINKVLGPEDLSTISFSKLEAMSAHLKKVVQTIGPGKEEGGGSHLNRTFEKKPAKLVLMKGNIESKKIGQLKKISKDEAIKRAYGLPGDDGAVFLENQYKSEKPYRTRSVEKSDDSLLKTVSFEKEKMRIRDQVVKKENSGLQIIIPETPPSEREEREFASVQERKREYSLEKPHEEVVEEKSSSNGEIFKMTKSADILNKPIKITAVNQEKSVVVLPEKQEKKGVLLAAIKEEEEDPLKMEPFRLNLNFKEREDSIESEIRPSQDRKMRKHSKDLPYNAQGQKRKRSDLEEISVFESGNLQTESLATDK